MVNSLCLLLVCFGNLHMKGMKSRKSQYIVLIDTNEIRAGFSGSFFVFVFNLDRSLKNYGTSLETGEKLVFFFLPHPDMWYLSSLTTA